MRSLACIQMTVLACAVALSASPSMAQTASQSQLPVLPGAASPAANDATTAVAPAAAPVAAPLPSAPTPPATATAAPAALPVASTAAKTPSPAATAAADVNLPATQQPATTAAPADSSIASVIPSLVGDGASSAASANTHFSFGDSDVSILFLPSQTQVMKQALINFESRPVHTATVEKTKEPTLKLDVIAEPHVNEPEKYPVYYLSSIVYHSPSDWSIWLSGHKITSAKNNTELKVTGISSDQATFSWTPGYSEALTLRKQHKSFAETDKVKHRLAATQISSYNENTGTVTFTLRPNQTFAVGYFSTFEGFMESPKLELALPAAVPVVPIVPAAPPQAPPESMDMPLKAKTIADVLHSREGDGESDKPKEIDKLKDKE